VLQKSLLRSTKTIFRSMEIEGVRRNINRGILPYVAKKNIETTDRNVKDRLKCIQKLS
jgi:hypothetical protein